jgi:hypothetical protein
MDEVCEVRELGFSTITQGGETFRVLSRAWASSRCCTRGGGDLPPSLAILHRYHGMWELFLFGFLTHCLGSVLSLFFLKLLWFSMVPPFWVKLKFFCGVAIIFCLPAGSWLEEALEDTQCSKSLDAWQARWSICEYFTFPSKDYMRQKTD